MAFKVVESRALTQKDLPVTLSYMPRSRRPDAPPIFQATFRAEFASALKWAKGEAVGLEIGEGEDSGKVRLMRKPKFKLGVYQITKSAAAICNLGCLEAFGRNALGSHRCQARVIDADTVEIDLPDWTNDGSNDDAEDDKPEAGEMWVDGPHKSQLPQRAPSVAANGTAPASLRVGNITVVTTPKEEAIVCNGEMVELSTKQAALGALLLKASPNPVGREFLRQKLKLMSASGEQSLSNLTSELRNACESLGIDVETVRGVGILMKEAA